LQALLTQAAEKASKLFGYKTLRPHQTKVLQQVFAGQDCIAILPTGSGKSLCYGLPAVVRPGLVLVISPLIALMRDQAWRFNQVGVPCDWLDSHRTSAEKDKVMSDLSQGITKILLISPERLARDDFREKLRSLPIQLIAVDEAHCISQWGGHFRPDYRLLGQYLTPLGPTQKLAVTATATSQVRQDIAEILLLQRPAQIAGEITRSNLKIKVISSKNIDSQYTALLHSVQSSKGCGIIYASTRKLVGEVHGMLRNAGIPSLPYHAGLPPDQRQYAQQEFIQGRIPIVVATNAFGLGIDKSDIRFVHHMGLPSSLEQYVQEIGRAGRDGDTATCWLFFNSRDYHVQKFMIDKSYPDVSHLKACLALIRKSIQGPHGIDENHALYTMRSQVNLPDRDLHQILDILYRESLLSRLRSSYGNSSSGYYADQENNSVIIFEGSANESQVLRTYPDRKRNDLLKLDAMKTYAHASDLERPRLLRQYFSLDSPVRL
jgi:ATP-dependent DNA helicase RecQ